MIGHDNRTPPDFPGRPARVPIVGDMEDDAHMAPIPSIGLLFHHNARRIIIHQTSDTMLIGRTCSRQSKRKHLGSYSKGPGRVLVVLEADETCSLESILRNASSKQSEGNLEPLQYWRVLALRRRTLPETVALRRQSVAPKAVACVGVRGRRARFTGLSYRNRARATSRAVCCAPHPLLSLLTLSYAKIAGTECTSQSPLLSGLTCCLHVTWVRDNTLPCTLYHPVLDIPYIPTCTLFISCAQLCGVQIPRSSPLNHQARVARGSAPYHKPQRNSRAAIIPKRSGRMRY
ncbi:hypothetical protein M8818_001919 [Zalaria obscura]|uniref:Uncharacterized protein n=1 Tax=Zalaria obscura TaxID=2024903 RepID=A0ACC3SJ07_9PEZI